jgi:hypothetical protein
MRAPIPIALVAGLLLGGGLLALPGLPPLAGAQAPAPTPTPAPAPKPEPPEPVDIPELADLEALMKAMGREHKGASNRNPQLALRSAKEIERLSLASLHPRLVIDDPEYREFAKDLWRASKSVQAALENPNDRKGVLDALKAQGNACTACHKKHRPEEESQAP